MIQFMCANCGKAFQLLDKHAGKAGFCSCGSIFRVPSIGAMSWASERRDAEDAGLSRADLGWLVGGSLFALLIVAPLMVLLLKPDTVVPPAPNAVSSTSSHGNAGGVAVEARQPNETARIPSVDADTAIGSSLPTRSRESWQSERTYRGYESDAQRFQRLAEQSARELQPVFEAKARELEPLFKRQAEQLRITPGTSQADIERQIDRLA